MKPISGNWLRKEREARGYSLRDFAKMIYASKSTLQRWEQTALPETEEVLARVAEVFSMTVPQMRKAAQAYEAEEKRRQKLDGLTAEQLVELKYGTKKLTAILLIGVGAVLCLVLIPVLLTVFL